MDRKSWNKKYIKKSTNKIKVRTFKLSEEICIKNIELFSYELRVLIAEGWDGKVRKAASSRISRKRFELGTPFRSLVEVPSSEKRPRPHLPKWNYCHPQI